MKIVIAPDSFKGSLTATEAADAIERGVIRAFCGRDAGISESAGRGLEIGLEVVKVPMADGGEGTVDSLVRATGGRIVEVSVADPLGEPVEAFYGILGDGATAVIEIAAASGLTLIPEEKRNPLVTTTYGTGELIRAALDQGCRRLLIGIGGSATNDGGVGMAQALGASFHDKEGNELGPGGRELIRLSDIRLEGIDPRIRESEITVACDVDNPLYGLSGAAYVYAPQKGARPEELDILDRGLRVYADAIHKSLGIDMAAMPGAGAAGGLGAGMVAFLGAVLKPGVDIVMDASGLRSRIEDADLVITGEGSIDFQSARGKTPVGVAGAAKAMGIPVIALTGSIGLGASQVYPLGIDSIFSIEPGPISLEEALGRAGELLEEAAMNALSAVLIGARIAGRPLV